MPDESVQLIDAKTESETAEKHGETGRKKTAAGRAAVFDEAL